MVKDIINDPVRLLALGPLILAALAILFIGLYAVVHDGVDGPQYISFLENVINICIPVGGAASLGHALISVWQGKKDQS